MTKLQRKDDGTLVKYIESSIRHQYISLNSRKNAVDNSVIASVDEIDFDQMSLSSNDEYAAGAKRSTEPSRRWLYHQGIPGQAGAQHHFSHPEKHQNGVLLPHHLYDLCTERGIEEVAESAGGRRDERPDTLP